MAVVKGFKFSRMREIHEQVCKLHAELAGLIKDSDAATAAAAGEDAPSATVGAGTIKNTTEKPASDNSDAGTSWGEDSARGRPSSTAQAMERALSNSRVNANR